MIMAHMTDTGCVSVKVTELPFNGTQMTNGSEPIVSLTSPRAELVAGPGKVTGIGAPQLMLAAETVTD